MQGQQLEAGEIPVLPFANDGSFLAAFHAMQQQQQQASVPPPPPPPASAALEPAERQPSAAPAAAGAADQPAASAQPPATGAASTADPPQTNAQPPSKPKVVIKPKQSIVQVRMRPAGGVTKKKAEAGGKQGASGKQSFYLEELERYRKMACDSKGGDRALVK